MNHPDVIRSFSLNNFFYLFRKGSLEIKCKDVTWVITEYEDGVQWDVNKYRAPEDVGIFISPGYSTLDDLLGTIFYDQIKQWIELKENV